MNLKHHLRKIFGIDKLEEAYYQELENRTLSDLKEDIIINFNAIISGTSSCNIVLTVGKNLEVNGTFTGHILGMGKNTVKINGTVRGRIFTELLNIREQGEFYGKASVDNLIMAKNVKLGSDTFTSEIRFDYQNVGNPLHPPKICLDYLERLK